jgi:hypothetical protein
MHTLITVSESMHEMVGRKDLDVHKHELKLNRNHMLKECNY